MPAMPKTGGKLHFLTYADDFDGYKNRMYTTTQKRVHELLDGHPSISQHFPLPMMTSVKQTHIKHIKVTLSKDRLNISLEIALNRQSLSMCSARLMKGVFFSTMICRPKSGHLTSYSLKNIYRQSL
jgi:hypothetical protein